LNHGYFDFLTGEFIDVINARTGQVQGERPYSAWKIEFAMLIGLAISAGIGYMMAKQNGG
jgi:hypothetical protein